MARRDKARSTEERHDDSQCSYTLPDHRCLFPGSIYIDGRRFCRWHFRCCDPEIGEALCEESELWRERINARLPVNESMVAQDGVRLPGYLARWQLELREEAKRRQELAERDLGKRPGESAVDYTRRLRAAVRKSFLNFEIHIRMR